MILYQPRKRGVQPVYAITAVYRFAHGEERLEDVAFGVVDFYGLVRAPDRHQATQEALRELPLGLDRWAPEDDRGQRRLLVVKVEELRSWRFDPTRMKRVEVAGRAFNVCF